MNMQPVKSSSIQSIGYDKESSTLRVQFKNGSVYEYANVPADAHANLHGADSVGRHHNDYIRGKFTHTRVS